MAAPPSSGLAAAAVASATLAALVAALARTVPLPTATAQGVAATARRTAQVDAPRLRTRADVTAIAVALVRAVQTLARDATPGDVAAPLYATAAACVAAAPTSASPALTRSYRLARGLCAAVEAACLGEAFLAEARTDFADQPAASAARTRITGAMDGARDRVADLLGPAMFSALDTAARETSAFLVAQAVTLQPIVRVRAQRSVPSTALAWSLYGDPTRAPDLVARNACATPLFMPATIIALAPKP